jgi:hypothetical protein
MSIMQKIQAMQARATEDHDYANRVKNQAIAAIYSGFGQPEWNAYMSNYADTIKEMSRLTTTEGDDIPYVRESRAYLVGNAVCLPGTTQGTTQGISPNIDLTLD